MQRAISGAVELMGSTATGRTMGEISERLLDAVQSFGFSSFIATGLPTYGEDVEDLIVADRWPDGWRDRYREQSYFESDPVSLWAVSRQEPFTWRTARESGRSRTKVAQIETEAEEFGLSDGLVCPVIDPGSRRAVVSFGTSAVVDISPAEAVAIQVAAVAFQHASARILVSKAPEKQLSEREREVLKWMGAGKTIWETGMILNISDPTVRGHIASAREKLGAANVTQAVAKAILLHKLWI